jgi:hypothetical protein
VELTSQIENGLFTLTGIGLIPVRTIDTYREPVSLIHLVQFAQIVTQACTKYGLTSVARESYGQKLVYLNCMILTIYLTPPMTPPMSMSLTTGNKRTCITVRGALIAG